MRGNIEIKPTYMQRTKETSCKYCTYSGICDFNSKSNSYAYVEKRTNDEIMEGLKNEEKIK